MRKLYFNWSNKLDFLLMMIIGTAVNVAFVLSMFNTDEYLQIFINKPELNYLFYLMPTVLFTFCLMVTFHIAKSWTNVSSGGLIFSIFRDICLKNDDIVLIKDPKSKKQYSGRVIINDNQSLPNQHFAVELLNQNTVCIPNYLIKRVLDN